MENQEKREAFLKDLKALIETKKKLEQKDEKQTATTAQQDKKQLAIVRYAFDQFENLSRDLKSSLEETIHIADRIPLVIQEVRVFL